jgi:hypothetical protein
VFASIDVNFGNSTTLLDVSSSENCDASARREATAVGYEPGCAPARPSWDLAGRVGPDTSVGANRHLN